MVAAVFPKAVSLGRYAPLCRSVLASLGAWLPCPLPARVTLASFLVSHLTPCGSATGTVLNVSTLEANGVAAARWLISTSGCARTVNSAATARETVP